MTASFSTKWPKSMGLKYAGKPNHFVEKILKATHKRFDSKLNEHLSVGQDYLGYDDKYKFLNKILDSAPKLHTLRQDPKNRWKVGMKIHPVINNRTKNRFQFSPVMEVKGIQEIEILHSKSNPGVARITIDGNEFYMGLTWSCYNRKLEDFVRNDGFDSAEQFFAWFNKDFKGKIISWADIKY